MNLHRARIPSGTTLSRAISRFRATLSLLRRTGSASIAEDASLLADLLHLGGATLVIRDTAGAAAARVLIQPDADIILTYERRCVLDCRLCSLIRDQQQSMCARFASAIRSLAALGMATRGLAAALSLLAVVQTIENLHRWLVQAALSVAIFLTGMLVEPVVRRLLLRWLLRYL